MGNGPQRAQLGCELLPESREISFVCFVGTSSKERVYRPPPRRAYTTVRELGDQEGSSPSTNTVADPPVAGTTQTEKPPICAVNTIHFPSGDQSGSEGLETPEVAMRCAGPPDTGTLQSARRSLSIFVAKQIHWPSGDQHGEESSSRVLVN